MNEYTLGFAIGCGIGLAAAILVILGFVYGINKFDFWSMMWGVPAGFVVTLVTAFLVFCVILGKAFKGG